MNVKKEIPNLENLDFKIPIKKKQEVVYTTLKLTQAAHEAINAVSQILGLTHSEVFDSMLSLYDAIEESKGSSQIGWGKVNIKEAATRKTYAIKKETLNKIRRVIKSNNINRDLFVDRLALVYKLLVDNQIADRKKKYPKILKEYITPFEEQANNVESTLRKELGVDDPLTTRFSYIVTVLMNLTMAIEGNINKDIPIDPEDISQQ